MKSPDEIKKGLECCVDGFSCRTTCPYTTPFFNIEKCTQALAADALALIQQLQAENAEKDTRIHQLEAERDEAVDLVRKGCFSCKHEGNEIWEEPCNSCRRTGGCENADLWEWRGVQKEE